MDRCWPQGALGNALHTIGSAARGIQPALAAAGDRPFGAWDGFFAPDARCGIVAIGLKRVERGVVRPLSNFSLPNLASPGRRSGAPRPLHADRSDPSEFCMADSANAGVAAGAAAAGRVSGAGAGATGAEDVSRAGAGSFCAARLSRRGVAEAATLAPTAFAWGTRSDARSCSGAAVVATGVTAATGGAATGSTAGDMLARDGSGTEVAIEVRGVAPSTIATSADTPSKTRCRFARLGPGTCAAAFVTGSASIKPQKPATFICCGDGPNWASHKRSCSPRSTWRLRHWMASHRAPKQ